MIIGVNLIQYVDLQGIEVVAQNLLRAIIEQNIEHDFVFFVNEKSAKLFSLPANQHLRYELIKIKSLARSRLLAFQQFNLPKLLKQQKIYLLFCPSASVPLFYKNKLVMLHDTADRDVKKEGRWFGRLYLRLADWSAKYWSRGVVTVSEFSKQSLIDNLGIKPEKITVIPNALPQMPIVSQAEEDAIKAKFNLNQPYFFYIGNNRPRKNLEFLIESFALHCRGKACLARHPNESGQACLSPTQTNANLLIAGKQYALYFNINQKIADLNLTNRVKYIGIVSETEKTVLYKNALAFVFPSLLEGFGLPVLEAQSLKVPVITSNVSALPEIGADSVLYIDPANQPELASAMVKITTDNDLRQELIVKGQKNCQRFSWQASARIFLNLLS